jgi:DNA-binding CsgD family transcriptional regulator
MSAAELSRIGGPGDPALWADARRQALSAGDRFRAAYAGWREAEALLIAGGDRSTVNALLHDAHAVAIELGADPLREHLEALARRARIILTDDPAAGTETDQAVAELELTPREIEVLALVGEGLTNREIAAQLFISDKTASVHVSRILGKLSVPNRAAAAATAQHLGLAGTESPAARARRGRAPAIGDGRGGGAPI